jgi:hypothetical protein
MNKRRKPISIRGRQVICTYCTQAANTKDHIPPKCMFPRPRPSTLITVPCCTDCNSSFSIDDEHFRDVLTFREELYNNSFVKKLIDSFPKRLARPQAEGYFNYLYERMGEETVKTTSGIYLGRKATFTANLKRVHRVIERITRGLYFYCFGNKLMEGFDPQAYTQEYFLDLDPEHQSTFRSIFQSNMANEQWIVVVPNGFEFKYKATNNPAYTVWMFRFYSKYYGFAVTLKQEERKQGYESKTYPPFIMIE